MIYKNTNHKNTLACYILVLLNEIIEQHINIQIGLHFCYNIYIPPVTNQYTCKWRIVRNKIYIYTVQVHALLLYFWNDDDGK